MLLRNALIWTVVNIEHFLVMTQSSHELAAVRPHMQLRPIEEHDQLVGLFLPAENPSEFGHVWVHPKGYVRARLENLKKSLSRISRLHEFGFVFTGS